MRLTILILSFLTGGYMLADGIYVMINGVYMGSPDPGPWSRIFEYFRVDVFHMGPLFIMYGIFWLAFATGFLLHKPIYGEGIILSLLTLWYLPVGTLFAIVVLVLLLKLKERATLQIVNTP